MFGLDVEQLIYLGLALLAAIYLIPPLLKYLGGRQKTIKLEVRDMTGAYFKRRIKSAKVTLRAMRAYKIMCVADDETDPVTYPRLKGVVRDTRCAEFLIKFAKFQIRPAWFLCPTELVESWVSPTIVCRCREFENMGVFYVPVLGKEDATQRVIYGDREMSKQEAVRMIIHDYVTNLWEHERRELVAEKTTDGMFNAMDPIPIPMMVVSRDATKEAEDDEDD